jgi:hypothetical protein
LVASHSTGQYERRDNVFLSHCSGMEGSMLFEAWYRTFRRQAFAILYRHANDPQPCKGLVCTTTTNFLVYDESRIVVNTFRARTAKRVRHYSESPYDPANQTSLSHPRSTNAKCISFNVLCQISTEIGRHFD